MRTMITEAKIRHGRICAAPKREPVFVEKAGRIDTVILSVEKYPALQARPDLVDCTACAARRQVIETEFAEWISDQIVSVAIFGIPGVSHVVPAHQGQHAAHA